MPFELVIDASDCRPDHLMDEAWCSRLAMVLPAEALRNCVSIMIVNCNKVFRKFMSNRWLLPLLNATVVADRITFLNTFEELVKLIDVKDGLMPLTVSALTLTSSWSDLEQLNRGAKKRADVALRLCKDVIQIEEPPASLFGGLWVRPLESIHISLLLEAVVSTGMEELTLRYRGLDGTLHVVSYRTKAAAQIASSIAAMRTRFQISSPAAASIKTRQITTSDVPGTLLNLALLNL